MACIDFIMLVLCTSYLTCRWCSSLNIVFIKLAKWNPYVPILITYHYCTLNYRWHVSTVWLCFSESAYTAARTDQTVCQLTGRKHRCFPRHPWPTPPPIPLPTRTHRCRTNAPTPHTALHPSSPPRRRLRPATWCLHSELRPTAIFAGDAARSGN